MSILWLPHPGQQVKALQHGAFEVLEGGAKGGGKTDLLLMDPLPQIHNPNLKSLFLRQTVQGYREALARAKAIYGKLGATWSEVNQIFTFPSGATDEFGHCADLAAAERYQGRQFHRIRYDEAGQLADPRVWTTLLAECRTTDPKIQVGGRLSANPGGPGHPWLKKRFVDPCGADGGRIVEWTDEETGITFTRAFVPAKVSDNPALGASYEAMLRATLTETQRLQLLEGDWNAGTGLALDEMSWQKHWIPPFEVPDHWHRYGAFDWGWSHPFFYIQAAVDEQGTIFVMDSVTDRHLRDDEIVESIRSRFGDDVPRVIFAGRDAWHEHRARGDHTPTTAQTFASLGMPLTKANVERKSGLKNLRNYLAWRGMGPGGTDGEPKLKIFQTPTNRLLMEQLESMVINPLDMEDVLKVDANHDTGEGGDDGYDTIRYLCAGRPLKSRELEEEPLDDPLYDGSFGRTMKRIKARKLSRNRGF